MPRLSGLLLHPTALPGEFGIGDLGPEALRFVDFLEATGQTLWQILPLGPTGFGDSPYSCFSTFAGNPLLLSPALLRDEGLVEDWELGHLRELPSDRVDFGRLIERKMALLWQAFGRFARDTARQAEFKTFCQAKASWLEDYALFMALKAAQGGKPWFEWPEPLRWRQAGAIATAKGELVETITFHKFLQFCFARQWEAVKAYANVRGIQIFGDAPIYVAGDSADVWANPTLFRLDKTTGEPVLMAGVPPDYFSVTGQLWGNPVYDWEALAATGYAWWIERMKHLLSVVDVIRIDHFRGFESFWAVPQGEKTAENGEWLPGAGKALFHAIAAELGELPIVAEDLGIITPEVEALRDEFGFPGMKILHFAFDSGSGNPYLPHALPRNCLVYTGTHDNDTTVGWFNGRSPEERENVRRYLGYASADGIQWDLIRTAWSTVADWAIAPVQDLLGLGSDCRFNLPGSPTDNWAWRLWPEALEPDWLRGRLAHFTDLYGRYRPYVAPPEEETPPDSPPQGEI